MNKARITYRFDSDREKDRDNGSRPPSGEAGRVIPLYQEEYRVVDEHTDHGEPAERPQAYPQEEREPAEDRGYNEAPYKRPAREIRDYQSLNQYQTDYGAWSSPFDAETERIEELIRESNEREGRKPLGEPPFGKTEEWRERRPSEYQPEPRDIREGKERRVAPAPAAESELRERTRRQEDDDRPDHRYQNRPSGYYRQEEEREAPQYGTVYRGGEREGSWDGPVVTGPRYVRHNRTPWLKISASIAGAAVTGVLLGFFALSLFNGPDKTDSKAAGDAPSAAQPVSANVQGTDAKTDAKTGAAAGTVSSGKEVALAYAGKSYSFLQHGIFSAQQGADQAKNELVKQGLAAATEQLDKFYVFAGMATDKDSAAMLSKQLKEANKLDIYVKSYAVPPVTKVHWNGSPDTLKSYLEQSDKLIQSVSNLTVVNLEAEGKPASIDAPTLQSVSAAHTAWSQLSTTVAQEAGDENKALIQKMNNAMNSAKASLDEYKKNPSTAMLWQAQTYTLQFIIAEKELITKIGA